MFRGHKNRKSAALAAGAALVLIAGAVLVSCGDDRATDPTTRYLNQTVSYCNTTFKRGELVDVLDGTLAVVAGFSADGFAAGDIVGGFIAGFVLNTLDFDALGSWGGTFSEGRYRIRNGGNTFDLYLVFDEPFAGYSAGDTLRENMFAPSSFVRNVSVDFSGVSFTKGPLYDLISGGISWQGTTPRFRIDPTRLVLQVVSSGRWYCNWASSSEVDTIHSHMASVPLDLGALKADFESGSLGFSYDSSRHSNESRKLRQVIYQSGFTMTPLDDQGKRWSWEGAYRNRVDRVMKSSGDSLKLFIQGRVSTVQGNGSSFYCDETMTNLIGETVEDTSLNWGYFKSVTGDSIAYGLVPTGK